jgi:hypothetical protein
VLTGASCPAPKRSSEAKAGTNEVLLFRVTTSSHEERSLMCRLCPVLLGMLGMLGVLEGMYDVLIGMLGICGMDLADVLRARVLW